MQYNDNDVFETVRGRDLPAEIDGNNLLPVPITCLLSTEKIWIKATVRIFMAVIYDVDSFSF